MTDPAALLEKYYQDVRSKPDKSFLDDDELRAKIEFVCRCLTNKAPIRFLMACLLGKLDDSKVDIRKPYTEISGKGTYSGRAYDEQFVEPFVIKYKLPTNSTTAFLTPAFRNIDRKLTTDLILVGRPRQAYTIAVLDRIGFVRHFLHFFHRYRTSFLDIYQSFVLAEPDSSVSQPLKEAFLVLRKAAESDK